MEKHIKEMLETDTIEPSYSPWSSNVMLVRKPDTDSYRFVLDLRGVNSVTKKDSYP